MARFRNTNLDDFYIDPENNHGYYKINDKWIDESLFPLTNIQNKTLPVITKIDNISDIIPCSNLNNEDVIPWDNSDSEDNISDIIPCSNLNNEDVIPCDNSEDQISKEDRKSKDILEYNIYLKLKENILDNIAIDRDIIISGTFEEKAHQLYCIDKIDPEWISCIKYCDDIYSFSKEELYVYGIINDIKLDDTIENFDADMLVTYILISMYIKSNDRAAIDDIVSEEDREILHIFALRFGFPRDLIKYLKFKDLKHIIITGEINVNFEKLEMNKKRYDMLESQKYISLIKELYKVKDIDEIIDIVPHILETIILNMDNYTTDQITTLCGICIPKHCDVNEYIIKNIISYKKVITRKSQKRLNFDKLISLEKEQIIKYLDKLTDEEIFITMGIKINYNSRNELIDNIVETITVPKFLYPYPVNKKYVTNKYTIIDQTPTNIINNSVIGYGTCRRYYIYEVNDLLGSFIESFNHPENTNIKFNLSEIDNLKQLLSLCEQPDELVKQIDKVLVNYEEQLENDQDLIDIIGTLTNNDSIKDFLQHIFYIGMYMRRWKGEGYPFPLKDSDTHDENDPNNKVTDEIIISLNMLEKMHEINKNFCLNLKVCEYTNEGYLDNKNTLFGTLFKNVISGDECIRTSSSKFIGTSYHYLRLLFKITIPGINIRSLDKIA